MIKQSNCLLNEAFSIFLTHGAGPFPILQKNKHLQMYHHLQKIANTYPNPKAIIIFSAHWEEKQWTLIDYNKPNLLYDYYGFPDQAYKLKYPAYSTSQLRNIVKESLLNNGYKLKSNIKRGYDHGVFIPLSIMYPQANIPVIQISILASLDPQQHFKMGKALRDLKKLGFLIIGSGSSVHGGFGQKQILPESKQFNEDLSKICLNKYNQIQILNSIKNWKNMKYAKKFHPREEHLVPFFINIGAYQGKYCQEHQYIDPFMGVDIRSYLLK